jgi:hypothetical protein
LKAWLLVWGECGKEVAKADWCVRISGCSATRTMDWLAGTHLRCMFTETDVYLFLLLVNTADRY